jgi:hypothetical protein
MTYLSGEDQNFIESVLLLASRKVAGSIPDGVIRIFH